MKHEKVMEFEKDFMTGELVVKEAGRIYLASGETARVVLDFEGTHLLITQEALDKKDVVIYDPYRLPNSKKREEEK